jgi:hypothetical protein
MLFLFSAPRKKAGGVIFQSRFLLLSTAAGLELVSQLCGRSDHGRVRLLGAGIHLRPTRRSGN